MFKRFLAVFVLFLCLGGFLMCAREVQRLGYVGDPEVPETAHIANSRTFVTGPRYRLVVREQGELRTANSHPTTLRRNHDYVYFSEELELRIESFHTDKSSHFRHDSEEFAVTPTPAFSTTEYHSGRSPVFIGTCPYLNDGKPTAMILVHGTHYKVLLAVEKREGQSAKEWLNTHLEDLTVN
jgi:hypothetical protein